MSKGDNVSIEKTFDYYIESITQEVMEDLNVMVESLSNVVGIFSKYFSSESGFARTVADDNGMVATFAKAKTAEEKRSGLVTMYTDFDKNEAMDIEVKTFISVKLTEAPVREKYVPVVINDEDSEGDGQNGYMNVLNIAKYGRATTKENFSIKPSDLVEEEKQYNVDELVSDVNNKLQQTSDGIPEDMKSMISQFMDSVVTGEEIFVENAKKYENAITNYVGEILGPIALINQNFITGDYDSVKKDLLDPFDATIEDMTVLFPASKNNPLADSVLSNGEVEILVSSKAGAGAAASVKSLTDILGDLPEHTLNQLSSKFEEDLNDLDIIKNENQLMGPLQLGVKYKLITDDQKDTIVNLVKENIKELPVDMEDMASSVNANIDNANYNAGYHILSVVARDVSDKINERGTFGDMVRGVLNNSTMVQLHLKVKSRGEDLAIKEFLVKYPPKFEGTIKLDSKKNYYSTGIKGKYTFKIK